MPSAHATRSRTTAPSPPSRSGHGSRCEELRRLYSCPCVLLSLRPRAAPQLNVCVRRAPAVFDTACSRGFRPALTSRRAADALWWWLATQVAYNALFNPALPKNSSGDGMPLMLRNVKGVTDFQLRFLQDKEGIFKTTYVYARLSGTPFEIECRSCSYCGSCFSGRFMELDSTHQRAGGWKEITEKIHAGNFSWKGLQGWVAPPPCAHLHRPLPCPPTPPNHSVPCGNYQRLAHENLRLTRGWFKRWRLCVPCFTNYGQKGTMENTNRLSIAKVLIRACIKHPSCEFCTA